MKKRIILRIVITMIATYVASMGVLVYFNKNVDTPYLSITTPAPSATPFSKVENIRIVALGDNLMHMPVVNSGKQDDGSFNFHHLYENMQPLIQDADLTVIGQETLLAGEKYGYSGFPLFNSPQDVGRTLVAEGFDLILCASNHGLDQGPDAVIDTLTFWKEYDEITTVGFNESFEEQNDIKTIDVKGVKIAVLNYTYDTNGIPLPKGREYLVNLIDKDKIEKDILKAKEIADYVIVFPHWGIEYSTTPSEEQTKLAQFMCNLGVDAIIGAHPHVMQPTETLTGANGNKTIVYYSLGNFISSQQKAINLLGGTAIIDLEVEFKDDDVNIILKSAQLMPTITHYNYGRNQFTVYPLKEYTEELANVNGVSAYDGAVSLPRLKEIVYNIIGDEKDIKFDY